MNRLTPRGGHGIVPSRHARGTVQLLAPSPTLTSNPTRRDTHRDTRDPSLIAPVSWTILPDNHHARGDLGDLGHEAFRLYTAALTATAGTAGMLTERDIRTLSRTNQIADPAAAVAELLGDLWERREGGYFVLDHERVHRSLGGRPKTSRDQTENPDETVVETNPKRLPKPTDNPDETVGQTLSHARAQPASQPASQPAVAPNGVSAVEPAVTGELIQRNGSLAKDLFEHYQQAGHPRAQPSEPNLKVIATRLRQGYSPDRIIAAFYGAQLDPWPGRKQNCSVEDLLRPKNLERFADWFEAGAAPDIEPEPDNAVDRQVRELTGPRPPRIS